MGCRFDIITNERTKYDKENQLQKYYNLQSWDYCFDLCFYEPFIATANSTYSCNLRNHLVASDDTAYIYDANGNQIQQVSVLPSMSRYRARVPKRRTTLMDAAV